MLKNVMFQKDQPEVELYRKLYAWDHDQDDMIQLTSDGSIIFEGGLSGKRKKKKSSWRE